MLDFDHDRNCQDQAKPAALAGHDPEPGATRSCAGGWSEEWCQPRHDCRHRRERQSPPQEWLNTRYRSLRVEISITSTSTAIGNLAKNRRTPTSNKFVNRRGLRPTFPGPAGSTRRETVWSCGNTAAAAMHSSMFRRTTAFSSFVSFI